MISKRKCGTINKDFVNQILEVNGWVKKNRKLGSLIFIDVADKTGTVQVIVDSNNKNHQLALSITRESVVNVVGKIVLRKNFNSNLATGEIEIIASSIKILSLSQTPPMIIEDITDALEDIRFRYRYLDLRRNIVKNKIIFRSQFIHECRCFLNDSHFHEIETPILSKTTPEGARDYLVPTRTPNKFFALPQSPQIYKQLLMVAGFDSYFQVARCFRDEDLRSDRQPEFTQLDIEKSFTNEEEIINIIESMLTSVLKKTMNKDISLPFRRMSFNEAMNKYGSDKPDLRFGLEINELNSLFELTSFIPFQNILKDKQAINGVFCKNKINNQEFQILKKIAADYKSNLFSLTFEDRQLVGGSIKKGIELKIIDSLIEYFSIENGTLLISADHDLISKKTLGSVRNKINELFSLSDSDELSFVWITDWPLFEFSEETQQWTAAHHPFTSPTDAWLKTFDSDKSRAEARAFDIVLNGFEIGGGSIRISNEIIQEKMFKAIGLEDKEIKNKFGFLLDAFRYGVPPHGGIALGLDRLIMILTKSNSIRDIIPFPKSTQGTDLMMDSPSKTSKKCLNELNLILKNQ